MSRPRTPSATVPVSRLEDLRREAGYTVSEFADVIGYSANIVSRVERGEQAASIRFREAACRVLSQRLGSIVFGPYVPPRLGRPPRADRKDAS